MIRVEHISKRFSLYARPSDRLKEVVTGRTRHSTHLVLDDVSLGVGPGEVLGIMGRNGAGKSTLLKIMMGLLVPDDGQVIVSGKVAGLLELGTGFNPELSGRQNINFNGMLIGMSAQDLSERRESIVAFAELGDYMELPIKVYSTGMLMRLAFAIAIHAQPACMVIDEALSVGDAYFQQKCMREIFRFRDNGGSIVLVTHDMNAVRALATHAVLLEGGRVSLAGSPLEVADRYQGLLLVDAHQGSAPLILPEASPSERTEDSPERPGLPQSAAAMSTGEAAVLRATLLNESLEPCTHVESETIAHAEFDVLAHRDLDEAHWGIGIRNQYGQSVFESNTYCMHLPGTVVSQGETFRIRFSFLCNLSHGPYTISLGISNKGIGLAEFEEYILLAHDVLTMQVLTNPKKITWSGITNVHPQVNIESLARGHEPATLPVS